MNDFNLTCVLSCVGDLDADFIVQLDTHLAVGRVADLEEETFPLRYVEGREQREI